MFSNKTIKSGSDYKRLYQERVRFDNKIIKNKSNMVVKLDKENKELIQRLSKQEEVLKELKQQEKQLALICVSFAIVASAYLGLILIIVE